MHRFAYPLFRGILSCALTLAAVSPSVAQPVAPSVGLASSESGPSATNSVVALSAWSAAQQKQDAVAATQAAAAAPAREGYNNANFTPVSIADWPRVHAARALPRTKDGATAATALGPQLDTSTKSTASGAKATAPTTALRAAGTVSAVAPPSIDEMARSLKNDFDLIFEYVHDNIETYPVWGIHKGAYGALIDRQGSSFDQAELFYKLMKASGYDVRYVVGVVNLTPQQVQSFYGIPTTHACAVQNYFALGQTPTTLITNAGDTCDSPLRGLLLQHIWVRQIFHFPFGNNYKDWDPSLKPHTVVPGIDLAAATGYTQASYLATARSGATITATSARNLNRAGVRSSLQNYANNLIGYIRANKPAAGLDDILGGRTIDRPASYKPSSGLGGLAYQDASYGETVWLDQVPNDMRVLLRVTFPGVDQLLLADYFYGKRLTIAPNANLEPQLMADGQVLATGTALPPGASGSLSVQVIHAAYGQNFADQGFGRTINSGVTYTLSLGLGPVTKNLGDQYRKQLAALQAQNGDPASEPVLGTSLSALGADWQAEFSQAAYLTDRLSQSNSLLHHQVGLVVNDGSPRFDLPGISYSVAQQDKDLVRASAAIFEHLFHGSAFESGVLEQDIQQTAVSTVALTDNAVAAGQTIYDANSSNYASGVQPNLVNCNSQFPLFSSLVANGTRLILPENCAQTVNSWTGFGYLTVDGTLTNTTIGAQISGGLNGGYITVVDRPGQYDDPLSRLYRKLPKRLRDWAKRRGDPIDLSSGAFEYSHDDLTIGTQDFPSRLAFQKSYSSANLDRDGILGPGWTHNYAMSAADLTYGLQGLGEDSPLDAATSIVETMVSLDLLNDTNVPVDKLATAMIGQRWFADQLNNNAVLVIGADRGELFVKLADGTYNAPPLSSGRLSRNADGTYSYSTADKVRYDFDAAGNIAKWASPSGLEVHFTYAGGLLTGVQNSLGRQLSLAYTGNKLTSVSDGTGRSVAYQYDAAGNLATFTDANSQNTTFQYDAPGRMTSYFLPANPAAAQVVNEYDTLGRVKRQTDADGKVWNYYVAGTRTEQLSPERHRAVDYFSGAGELLATVEDCTEVDAGGWSCSDNNQRMFWYDGLGRLMRQVGSREPLTEFTYDDASCNSAEKRCTHNLKTRREIALYTPTGTPGLPDKVENYTYEPLFNRVSTYTDARGKVTNYAYDGVTGNPVSVTLPPPADGGTLRPLTTYGYTSFAGAAGFPNFTLLTSRTRKIDASGSVTTALTYDSANGFVPSTTVVDSGGLNITTTYGFNNRGDVTSVDGPRSDVADVTRFAYDAERRLTDVTDAAGKVTRTAYNADGDVVRSGAQIGTQWLSTCYTRLVSGKVSKVVGPSLAADDQSCPAGAAPVAVKDLAYDPEGRLLTSSINRTALEGGNQVTQFSYTPSGELVTTAAGVGSAIQQNALSIAISAGNATSVTYTLNSANTAPSGGTAAGHRQLVYDGHGRLSQQWFDAVSCPGSRTTYGCDQFAYDVAGNLTSWTRSDGLVVNYTYDNLGRVTQKTAPVAADNVSYTYDLLGRMLTASGTSGVSYSYDKAGRVLSATGAAGTLSYQYDPAGNRTRVTWPGGTFFVTYDYDALNRLTNVRENGTTLLATYSSDDLSRRTAVSYGNSSSAAYGYDAQSRLLTLSHDLAGTAADVTRTFGHDQAGALTSIATSNGAYDWNGHYNISRSYTNDGGDRYKTSGSKTLTYDGRGNLTGDGTWTFGYDAQNRMTSAAARQGANLTYTYDTLGRLVTRKLGSKGTPVTYLYDGNQLVGEYNGTALVRRYVRGTATDEPIVIYDGTNAATKTWLYSDQLGSVTAAANASGTSVATMSYGPFGEPNVATGIAIRYTGQALDPDTGLYYYKARWYSPYLGRFLSADPAFVDDGFNLYAYAGNDPVDYTDPTGKWRQASRTLWHWGKPIAEWIPGVGTGIAVHDAWKNPNAANIAAAAASLLPEVGAAAGKLLRRADEVADVAKGGLAPVLKGQQGVEQSIAKAESEGSTVIGKEITIDTGQGTTRMDLAVIDADGNLKFIESKCGPSACLNSNQKTQFPIIEQNGGTPRGNNAAAAGLPPGQAIGPTPVQVDYWPH